MCETNRAYNKRIIEIIEAHPLSWVVPLKRKENKHLLAYVREFTSEFEELTLPERIYWTLNDMHDYPKCQRPRCDNKIVGARCWPLTGYKVEHCCNRCYLLDPIAQEKARKRRLEETGYEYGQQRPECRKHMSETMKGKSPEEKAKSNKRRKKTCRKKYGVDSVSKLQEHKDSVIDTWNQKSQDEIDKITKRRKRTKKERYGDENYMNAEQVKKTRAGFTAERKQQIESKRRKTCLDNYGAPCVPRNLQRARDKNQQLAAERRTKLYYETICNNEFVEPLFTVEHFLQHPYDPLEWKCKLCGRTFIQAIGEHSTRDKIVRCLHCFPLYENRVLAEDDIIEYIKSFYGGEVIQRARSVISPRELDIWIPAKKVAIEYNGVYWHSLNMETKPEYHIEKTEECESKGIRLLQVFENEWNDNQDAMKSLIRHAIEDSDKKEVKLEITCEKQAKNKVVLKFNGGKATLRKEKFKWILESIQLEEDSACSFAAAASQLADYAFKNLGARELELRLDRRFFAKKDTIGSFKLARTKKPQTWHYLIKTRGTTFCPKSQCDKLLKEAKGNKDRVFAMVDCGQLVYRAKGTTVK